jgi:Bacterial alpha-L-rhamnosidase 6 hairpin glycosidase domain/Bacterial alpha-L-rhamnosidase C-terminal domain
LLDNTWYLLALDAAAQIAPLVGQAGDTPLYSSRAQGIRNQYNTAFWTGTAYRSASYSGETDERGNAMAVLAGLTGPSQAAALRTVLDTEQHCSPYMEKYVLEALFTLGYPDDALARMRSRYAAMVSSSSTTLWETFPANGGFNHGWSGGPLTLLDEQVAGVTPTSPGFATFDVRPALGTTLARAGVDVPSRRGLIRILASRNVNNYRLSVRVPPGSAGRAFQPGSGGLLSGAILAVAGGVTATLDETLATPEINIADGDATLLSTNGGMGGVIKNGSGNLLLGAGSALSVAAFEIIQGETILSAGRQLTVTAGIATNGTGQVCDGHLTIWPGAVLSNQGGTVSCASLTNLGVCECLGGSLIITGNATNGGTLRLLGNAQLHIGGAFSNSGVLDIMTWSGTLPPGFVNHGVLLDRTAIKVESCAVEGGDFEVTIMGYAGHSYQLQCSNGLRPAVWTNVGTAQAGSEAPLVLTHVNGMAVAQRFYRVAVDPPSDSK